MKSNIHLIAIALIAVATLAVVLTLVVGMASCTNKEMEELKITPERICASARAESLQWETAMVSCLVDEQCKTTPEDYDHAMSLKVEANLACR